ncbi:hypothetical protein [Sphingobium nicotianae]|uniref:Uncharacterized protein n=1 Tax=Sphingobium nicotianae TaxID=2782607 RepID=A0A9X1AJF9_9SPHN|nr:hypothetical protein [Sphingobium nicotianae]MBT2185920.1 hypothetical protein [Sphingobium nicotianae]
MGRSIPRSNLPKVTKVTKVTVAPKLFFSEFAELRRLEGCLIEKSDFTDEKELVRPGMARGL